MRAKPKGAKYRNLTALVAEVRRLREAMLRVKLKSPGMTPGFVETRSAGG